MQNDDSPVHSKTVRRILKRSTNKIEQNSNFHKLKSAKTAVPPPPPRKIVYQNPSEDFYLRRRAIKKSHSAPEVDEDERYSNEIALSRSENRMSEQSSYKDSVPEESYEEPLFVKHDELSITDEPILVKQLFTPNEIVSVEDDDYEDNLTISPVAYLNRDNVIQSRDTDSFGLLPQSSRRVNTVKFMSNSCPHDWKRSILEDMRDSLSTCCDDCKTQTLSNLDRKLQFIHNHISRELEQHYARITSSLLADSRKSHEFNEEHDVVRERGGNYHNAHEHSPSEQMSACSNTKTKSHKIVQVQLNDDLSDNFKKVVFKVSSDQSSKAPTTKRLSNDSDSLSRFNRLSRLNAARAAASKRRLKLKARKQ